MNIPGKVRFKGVVIGIPEAENFLDEIVSKKLTGYLKIEWHNLKFLLLFENGDPLHGFRVIEDKIFSFSHLADVIRSLKGGTLSFFETTPGALQALLDMKFGDQIYGTLYTSFTDLRKLFVTLEQKKHTGSVEIDLPSGECFVLMEDGTPQEVACSQEGDEKEPGATLKAVLGKAAAENGVVRVFERRNPPTFFTPDLEEVFSWSNPRRLKLEFAFGQLGKEFEDLLDKKLTISQILNSMYVDFVEIADMYTYLSAKGYITTEKM